MPFGDPCNAPEHARWRPGYRRLPDPREGALCLRPVRPRQYPVHRRAVRAPRRHQDHLGASRDRRRLHGRCLLPRLRPADRDLHLLRARQRQPADRARQRLSRFGAVPGGDRQRADQPVQPRRLPGALSPLPGGLSVHRALDVQEGVPADPRRAGAADGAAGLEDHGHRPPRPGGARRAVRCVQGGRRHRDAEAGGMERQHLLPLRRRSRRGGQGGRPAARRRKAGDPGRPGRALRRRRRGPARARRAAADSGGVFGERSRRAELRPSAVARPGLARRPSTRPTTPPARPTCCWRSAFASTTAPRRRGFRAIRSPSRRPS